MRLVEPAIVRPGVTELPVEQRTSRGENVEVDGKTDRARVPKR